MLTHFFAALLVGGLPTPGAGATPKADPAVDSAVCKAAIQIYDSFHENRAELDSRWAELTRVEQGWRAAGCPANDRQKLLDWMASAQLLSQSDSVGPLPEVPTFTPDPEEVQRADDAKTLAEDAEAIDAAGRPTTKPTQPTAQRADKPAQSAVVDQGAAKESEPVVKLAKPPADKPEKLPPAETGVKPAAENDAKPAAANEAKAAHPTSVVSFVRNLMKKLESSADEPADGPSLKPAGK